MEVGCGQAVKGIGPGYRLKTIFLSQAVFWSKKYRLKTIFLPQAVFRSKNAA